MSEIAIFSFGSVVFILTTWATFSFGLKRMGELQARELQNSSLKAVPSESGLTEIHVEDRDTP